MTAVVSWRDNATVDGEPVVADGQPPMVVCDVRCDHWAAWMAVVGFVKHADVDDAAKALVEQQVRDKWAFMKTCDCIQEET